MARHAAAHAAPAPRRRRLLVPLVTLLAASAVAIGSGATFTSTSANPGNGYASGTLTQTNDRNGTWIFNKSNLKPGDVVVGNVTITNSGTLPAAFTLTEKDAVNGFVTKANLTLKVQDVTAATPVTVFTGTFGTLPVTQLGTFAAGEVRKYAFVVTLDSGAGNEEQGKSASAEYVWGGAQTAATTYVQTGGVTTPAS